MLETSENDTEGGSNDALLDGVTLAVERSGSLWCSTAVEPTEPPEPAYRLIWPDDFTFDATSGQVIDATGDPVARTGDTLRVSGGVGGPGPDSSCDDDLPTWYVGG